MKILDRSRPPVSILDFPPEEIRDFLRTKLAEKGVHEAYIFGSFADGTCTPWSDLDLLAVMPSEEPFIERPRAFADLQDLGVPIDLLIYTPEEFAGMQADPTPFWKAFQRRNVRIL